MIFMKRVINVYPRKYHHAVVVTSVVSLIKHESETSESPASQYRLLGGLKFPRVRFQNYILLGYECNLQTSILPSTLDSDVMKTKNIRKTCKNNLCYNS